MGLAASNLARDLDPDLIVAAERKREMQQSYGEATDHDECEQWSIRPHGAGFAIHG